MRMRYLVVAVIVVAAYLLGARAGRERYDVIVASVSSYWNNPQVKKARKQARKQVAKAQKAAAKRMR